MTDAALLTRGKGTKLSREVQSYLVPFTQMPREIYWFNDSFQGFTWSRSHVHLQWGEFAYVRSGCMVMCTAQGNYMVRPDCAVWIPPGMPHGWYIPCDSWDCGLYIVPEAVQVPAFASCSVFSVTPLVRELILHLAGRPWPYEDQQTADIVRVLLHLVRELPLRENPLVMPADPRLIELCATIITNPGTAYSLEKWGHLLGMSTRNLSRLFLREIGMTFRQWRQHIRLEHARSRLQQGESVTSVALDCGYSSVSAFIERFREKFGITPGQISPRPDLHG